MVGIAKGTAPKLLRDIGEVYTKYQDKVFKNLSCNGIQCNEIWSFCYTKGKNVTKKKKGNFGYGDVLAWTVICANTKLVPIT
jgi:hypothetical protein